MRKIILAALGVAATVTGATAADAQYYGGGYGSGYGAYNGYGRGDGICRREASRAWGRHDADRIYRHCLRDLRHAERDRERAMRYRYNRGW